jgi:DNA-binding SARP family transcriptional activator/Tfp pilus assembly protein PilF
VGWSLRLCGVPCVVRGDRRQVWPASAPRALLALLACRPGWWSREALTAVLRPEAPDADALRYLRQAIHRARQLPEAEGLEVAEGGLRWSIPSDVAAFRAAAATDDPAALEVPVDALLAGWRAPNPAFAAWIEEERADLLRLRRRLARVVCMAHAAAGDPARAAEAAMVLLHDDPLDEAVVADVLRWRGQADDPAGGLAQYEAFCQRLADEVGASPSRDLEALAERLRADLQRRARRPRRVAEPHVVPTSFVGRDVEMARFAASLQSEGPRVIALVGLGGAGKTRLVVEAAAQARRAGFEVAMVALGDDLEGEGVAERVAAALPVARDVVGADARWRTFVARGRVVVVLDEVERATDLDAWWGEFAPRLGAARLWLTSRVAPRWSAVSVWPVGGLAVPPVGAGPGVGRGADAVRLLLERAGFDPAQVSDPDVAAAADAARALGGHPLALELAAAAVRGVPPSVAFAELGLDGGRAPVVEPPSGALIERPVRHRDLSALLADSWGSLPHDARRWARRLSLLRGTFDAAAASAVAEVDAAGLSRLLDRAFVQRVGAERYEVHALIRSSAPPFEPGDRDAHARWALGRVAELGARLRSERHAEAIEDLQRSTEDARAAWTHAVAELTAGRTEFLALLDAALDPLDHAWHASGRLGLAAAVYREAWSTVRPWPDAGAGTVDGLAPADPALARWWWRLLVRWSVAERNLGRPGAATAALEGLAADDRAGQGDLVLEALIELAKGALARGRLDEAERRFRCALAHPATRSRSDLASAAHTGLAQLLWTSAGDVGEALGHDDAALVAARRDGDPDALIVALINAGAGAFELGQDAEAERRWIEAAGLAESIGHAAREAALWNNLGLLALRRGEFASGRDAFERSLALRRSTADRQGQATVRLHLGQLEAAVGDRGAAARHLEEAVAAFGGPGDAEGRSLALSAWSELAATDGDARRAEARALEALAAAREAVSVRASLGALLAVARAWSAAGELAPAVAVARSVAHLGADRDAAVARAAERFVADHGDGVEVGLPATDLATLADEILAGRLASTDGWNAAGTPRR